MDGEGFPPRERMWMVLKAPSAPKGVSSTPNARRDWPPVSDGVRRIYG
jgi:hypothetical protein